MNMMFEEKLLKDIQLKNKNYEIIPVASLDEVVTEFSKSDSEEFFLLRVKTQSAQPLTPPPFKAREIAENVEQKIKEEEIYASANEPANTAAQDTAEKISAEDIIFLTENAEVLFSAGEIALARNIYRAILKTGEASDLAYAGLAECSDKEGLLDQAIQFAWDSVAFAPNKKGYRILSQLLVQQGRDREASSTLSRAVKLLDLSSLEKAEYYKMMGNCFSRLGETDESERAYKKALEISPDSDEVQSNLGSLYLEQSKMTEAKRCYQDAISANPKNDKAWVGLGLCLVADGDKEQAHDAFAKSLELNLRNSTAIFHLVKCAYETKKYSNAEKILKSYVEVAPVSPSLLYSLAGLQFHVNKKKDALITAKRILQIKVDHQGAKDLIARIELEGANA